MLQCVPYPSITVQAYCVCVWFDLLLAMNVCLFIVFTLQPRFPSFLGFKISLGYLARSINLEQMNSWHNEISCMYTRWIKGTLKVLAIKKGCTYWALAGFSWINAVLLVVGYTWDTAIPREKENCCRVVLADICSVQHQETACDVQVIVNLWWSVPRWVLNLYDGCLFPRHWAGFIISALLGTVKHLSN